MSCGELLGAWTLEREAMARAIGQTLTWLRDLPPGARVAVASRDDTVVAPLLAACRLSGHGLLLLEPSLGAASAWHALLSAEARALLVDQATAGQWAIHDRGPWGARWLPVAPPPRRTLAQRLLGRSAPEADTWPAVRDRLPPADLPHPAPSTAELALLRTGGTTGGSKVAILTQHNVESAARLTRDALQMPAGSRVLVLAPASHYDGMLGLYLAARHGLSVIRPGPFGLPEVGRVLDLVYRHQATHVIVVPSFLRMAQAAGEDLRAALAVPSMRMIVSMAEPLPEPLWTQLEQLTGLPVVNVWGMTEVGNATFAGPAPDTRVPGTIGAPRGCEVRLVDDDHDAPDGQPGELWVRGPCVCPGYLGAPREGEWLHTGDLAVRRPDGLLRLVGRRSGMIKTAGHRVMPDVVDEALQRHPAVAQAVAVGLPDPVWGERVVAAVVARAPVTADELRQHAAGLLAEHEVPREIVLLDALPVAPSGKVLRRDVLALLQQQPTEAVDDARGVLEVAAAVFRTPAERLSLATAAGRLPGWDSVAHLDLALALERRFGIRLQPKEIVAMTTLDAAVRLVEAARRGQR